MHRQQMRVGVSPLPLSSAESLRALLPVFILVHFNKDLIKLYSYWQGPFYWLVSQLRANNEAAMWSPLCALYIL